MEYKRYQAAFPWFIKEAHKAGTKIHGLGYTSLNGLHMNHFDSVDSTAWTTGNRFGYVYKFTGDDVQKVHKPYGKRIGDARMVAKNNFQEWIKFQKYAVNHL